MVLRGCRVLGSPQARELVRASRTFVCVIVRYRLLFTVQRTLFGLGDVTKLKLAQKLINHRWFFIKAPRTYENHRVQTTSLSTVLSPWETFFTCLRTNHRRRFTTLKRLCSSTNYFEGCWEDFCLGCLFYNEHCLTRSLSPYVKHTHAKHRADLLRHKDVRRRP